MRPRLAGDHHFSRVDLVNGRKFGVGMQRRDSEAAVAGDRFGIVVAAEADVEARALADGHAAAAAEETVRKAAEADRADDLDVTHSSFRMMMSSSA
jgi:hypothetical protein